MGHRLATAGPPPGIAIDIENVAARNLLVVAVFASEEYGYHATLPHPWQTNPFAVTFPVSVVLRFPQHTHRVLPGIFATPAMTARLAVLSLNWLFETGSPRL